MRFTDDDELSLCLTLSTGISRNDLLNLMGRVETLAIPQGFDDFAWETCEPGKIGLLNLFEDGERLVSLENNGFKGVYRRTINDVAGLPGAYHYVAVYHSSGNGHFQYVEIQDGMILANFDPLTDEAPEVVADFFTKGGNSMAEMLKAAEYRMECTILPEWLEKPAETFVIDYRA